MTADDWNPAEDGKRGAKPTKFDTLDASTTIFLVALTDPTPSLARVTIKQCWGGQWSISPGRIWPDREDDGA